MSLDKIITDKTSRISWDKTWLDIARIISQRTSCIKFQVGCVLVSSDNKHSVMGYNGSPSGAPNCCDVGCAKDEGGRCRGCHAEINAIINCHGSPGTFKGGAAYVTIFPCNECAKALCQAGIKRVVYVDDYSKEQNDGLKIFSENNVRVEKWDETKKCTTIIRSDNSDTITPTPELRKRVTELIIYSEGEISKQEKEKTNWLTEIGIRNVNGVDNNRLNDVTIFIDTRLINPKKLNDIYLLLISRPIENIYISFTVSQPLSEFKKKVEELIMTIARGIRDSMYQR
ncbi:MAG: Late competence operon required for DNA binding and uptake [Berkelbacteria bacterium GW2011_GWA2_35_9]|uniref:Late competence operon required for DNA binding and uptake n=1 Tax=Berkelbacteria bacterium GW2011_GWA2_35_9 TaxID=1618333 RepID=A0A0G0G919_9BACT|nr:MAG: Late competence operon required for DNA binding and uptake [Berkelbacteria bacterium GW2011_GWA2_35_9]